MEHLNDLKTRAQSRSLARLIGERLSGVAFVQDYVEFHFDGKILRALTPPSISFDQRTFTFPTLGSRDALCSAIGLEVDRVNVHEGDHIDIGFVGGSLVRVPLSHDQRTGPEAAHFVPGDNQPIDVW